MREEEDDDDDDDDDASNSSAVCDDNDEDAAVMRGAFHGCGGRRRASCDDDDVSHSSAVCDDDDDASNSAVMRPGACQGAAIVMTNSRTVSGSASSFFKNVPIESCGSV